MSGEGSRDLENLRGDLDLSRPRGGVLDLARDTDLCLSRGDMDLSRNFDVLISGDSGLCLSLNLSLVSTDLSRSFVLPLSRGIALSLDKSLS